MSFSITQEPAEIVLSQSPIVFTLYETSSAITTTGSFQYVTDLYYWTGSATGSGSTPDYTFVKYPNEEKRGIFDVSKVMNSLFTQPVEENKSQAYYFAIDGYYQYKDGSGTTLTGSVVRSDTYTALDGYGLFGESIDEQIWDKSPYWPILTSGPSQQNYTDNNTIEFQVWTSGSQTLKFDEAGSITSFSLTGSNNDLTSEKIQTVSYTPSGSDFYVVAINLGVFEQNERMYYDYTCQKKYPNVRIKWKNRFGAFDFFNFNLVSRETFNVSRQKYQPQLGNWNSTQFGYNNYDSQIQNYLVDTEQKLRVNSDYVSEDYNDIFKEMMVSDEIYWIYDETNGDLRPISIDNTSLAIKTNVVDKLIQYSFDFTWGQPYKLQL